MFKKMIIIGVIVLIILILVVLLLFRKKNGENQMLESLKELSYEKSDGRSMYGRVSYHILCDDSCILESNLDGYHEEDIMKSEVDSDTLEEILSVLNQYHVSSWDGFNKVDKTVLDGSNFTFKVVTKEGKRVYATGYMKYPKNYREVINELTKIFDRINQIHFKKLFEMEPYHMISLENIEKIKIDEVRESGIETKEITEEEEIKKIFEKFQNMEIGITCRIEVDDYSTIYHFILKDNQDIKVEDNYYSMVIDGKHYYYRERN